MSLFINRKFANIKNKSIINFTNVVIYYMTKQTVQYLLHAVTWLILSDAYKVRVQNAWKRRVRSGGWGVKKCSVCCSRSDYMAGNIWKNQVVHLRCRNFLILKLYLIYLTHTQTQDW
jgi:hypothetical protein